MLEHDAWYDQSELVLLARLSEIGNASPELVHRDIELVDGNHQVDEEAVDHQLQAAAIAHERHRAGLQVDDTRALIRARSPAVRTRACGSAARVLDDPGACDLSLALDRRSGDLRSRFAKGRLDEVLEECRFARGETPVIGAKPRDGHCRSHADKQHCGTDRPRVPDGEERERRRNSGKKDETD